MLHDVRYALRMLCKSKFLTVTALLSLALGIGANTALFSVIDGLMLRELAVDQPAELVLLNWAAGQYGWFMNTNGVMRTDAKTGERTGNMFSYLAYEGFRDQSTLAEIFGFFSMGYWNVSLDGQSHVATGQVISGNYHSVLRITPEKGRMLSEEDDSPTAAPVAVISYRYWERQLGRDPNVVGKTIYLNRIPVSVVGVTSRQFEGVQRRSGVPDISLPMAMEPRMGPASRLKEPWRWWVNVMGRLKSGASAAAVQANLNAVFQDAAREGWETAPPEDHNERTDRNQPRSATRLVVASSATGFDNMSDTRTPVLMLSVITGLVLLIVCANLANLLLAKSGSRHREIALRLSLGASRWRLLRQLLTESVVLALSGGILGLLVGYWANGLFERWLNGDGMTSIDLRLNPWVLAATITVSLVAGILFGLAPALRTTGVDLNDTLKETSRSMGGSRSRLSKSLLVAQVAMSLVLLVGAGLFLGTLRNLQTAAAGFDRENLLWFTVNPQLNRYPADQIVRLYDRIIDALQAIPGVRSATISQVRLLSGNAWTSTAFKEGAALEAASGMPHVHQMIVRPNFLDTVGMRLLLGRNLNEQDVKTAPKVALINETMARKHFAGENPIGKRFKFGILPASRYIEIVGVVSDTKYTRIQAEVPATVYTSYLQETIGGMHFAVRTTEGLMTIAPQLTEAVYRVDKDLPLFEIKTQEQEVGETQNAERGWAVACSVFGILALALASIGLYGIMSFSVTRRTSEIGVRMALGASGGNVVRMVMREGMLLVGFGVIIGIAVALGVARLIASQLYGLQPGDPFTILTAVLLMLGVAGFAGYLPARRAAKVDPMVALRYE
jgi:predicted permease